MAAQSLVFQNITFDITDHCGQPWLRGFQIGSALGYKNPSADIPKLFERNADEFSDDMTALVELDTAGGKQSVRIFSLRGAHLLGMLAKTDQAKAFRRWVLDVLTQKHNSTDYIVSSSQLSSDVTKFNGQAVLTVRRLAACFGLTTSTIQNYSRQHASHLLENTHYFQLTGETQRHFRLDNRSSPDTPSRNQPSLTVWTEAGALQLAQCISLTFATQAMPAVRRYLYTAAPAPAQPYSARPTLATPPDGRRLLLSTDRHGNIQSEPVPLDAFVVRREELAARIAARDEIWTRAELAAILTAAANRLAG